MKCLNVHASATRCRILLEYISRTLVPLFCKTYSTDKQTEFQCIYDAVPI